jgi:hypothetical protein
MARTAKEFRRIYHSEAYMRWIRYQPCVACGDRPCEAHHTRSGGVGRKADWATIVPLCHTCHRVTHDRGRNALGVDWESAAAKTRGRWELEGGP